MKWYPFAEVVSDVTSKFRKIKASEYQPAGQFKIIDQGKDAIAGYTSDKTLINDEQLPIIIFGDHTRVLKYEENPIALGADGAKALKVDPEIANTLYVYYYLKSIKLKEAGYSRHFKFLKETKVPIPTKDGRPSLDDQKRIAHLLGKVEELITQRKQHLQQLDDLLKSVFLEMFGDPVRNEKEWENRQLQELCASPKDIKCGPFGTQLGKSEFKKTGIAVWGIPQINSEFSIPPRDFVTQEKASELEEYSVRHNDIVMSRKGTVGKCSLYPPTMPPGIMHSDVLRIRADCTETNPVYLCWQLRISRNVERQIANVSSGAIMAGINVGKLKSITVLAPPIFLQNEFSSIVEKVENLKSRYQQSLTDLEALYGALSQKAFKGELDLSQVPLV